MKIIGFDDKDQRVFFEAETGTQYSVKVGDSINDIVAEEAAQQELPRGRKATSAQEEVDRLGERLAENHAKLQSASRQ